MSRGRQKVSFEGLMQENVLGTFKIIRGFAELSDLVAVSKAMLYEGSESGHGTGYQRKLNEEHVEDIKRFLSRGRHRFFPEIVLSLRSNGKDDPIVSYFKKHTAPSNLAYKVSVNLNALQEDGFTRIHRIDGNHRLEAAKRLIDEEKPGSSFKDFHKAPFCFVVLDSDRPQDDELSEAMLFNLINSKALSIASEHSLSVLMQDDSAAAERFIEDPQVYLTRWIKDKVSRWPRGFYQAMGDTPLSRLHSAAGVLLRPNGIAKTSATEMESDAEKIFGPLYELAVLLREEHEKFVHSFAYLPVAAEVYIHHTTIDGGEVDNTEPERIRRALTWLRAFAQWFDRVSGADLPVPADPCVLWTVFKRDYDKRAGQIFIAMSFRESVTLDGVKKAFEEAIDQFNKTHSNSPLFPMRIDNQHGESYEIPSRVFGEIAGSRLVIADLTDERPNVYCEIGYAKALGIPFILTFHKNGTSSANKVHFDLVPYRYIEYDNPIDLRDKLRDELIAWREKA